MVEGLPYHFASRQYPKHHRVQIFQHIIRRNSHRLNSLVGKPFVANLIVMTSKVVPATVNLDGEPHVKTNEI